MNTADIILNSLTAFTLILTFIGLVYRKVLSSSLLTPNETEESRTFSIGDLWSAIAVILIYAVSVFYYETKPELDMFSDKALHHFLFMISVLTISIFIVNLPAFPILFRLLFYKGHRQFTGWKPKFPIRNLVKLPIIFFAVTIGIETILDISGFSTFISEATNSPEKQDVEKWLLNSPTHVRAIIILFVVIIGPPLEEITFRGFLYPVLKKYAGRCVALISSSLLFSLLHVHVTALIPLFIFGVAAALLYEKTKTLWAPILFHCIHNAAAVIIIFYFPDLL